MLLPDVNESSIPYAGINRRVRVGLMQVQGLSVEAMEAVCRARAAEGPFRSLEDFLRRVALDPSDARLLIRAGAFDSIAGGATRPELMWRWVRWNEGRGASGPRRPQRDLFGEPEGRPQALPAAPDYDEQTMLRHEAATLGFLISRHPLTLYRREIEGLRRVAGEDLHKHAGRSVTTIGWLVTGKVVDTKQDEPMEFVSFEDTTAITRRRSSPMSTAASATCSATRALTSCAARWRRSSARSRSR